MGLSIQFFLSLNETLIIAPNQFRLVPCYYLYRIDATPFPEKRPLKTHQTQTLTLEN
jgi:hypothetical protein